MTAELDKFRLFFRLTKVDEQQRLVYGRATQEVPDSVREVMDYQTSKPYFEKWSQAAKNRTAGLGPDGQSLGNVREMHQPVAAGKVTGLEFNDAEKAIDISTYCADDNSWNKILKGVLTGFSVGGDYVKRWPDYNNPSLMRYTANPAEVSYVDSPAVPTATFTMIKADGTQELRKAQQPDPLPLSTQGDNPAPDVPPASKELNPAQVPSIDKVALGQEIKEIGAKGTALSPDLINNTRAVVPGTTERNDPVEKSDVSEMAKALDYMTVQMNALQAELNSVRLESSLQRTELLEEMVKLTSDEKGKVEAKLKALGSRVGIARKSGEPLTPPTGYPTDPSEYGDPANYSWPLDKKDRVQSAMSYFNGGKGKDKYSDREWNILGRRIAIKATKLFGRTYSYSPSKKEVTSNEVSKMVDVMPLIQQVQQAINVAADKVGNDPAAVKDLLMNVIANLDDQTRTSSVDTKTSSPSAPSGSQERADTTVIKAVTPVDGSSPYGASEPKPTSAQIGTPATQQTSDQVKATTAPSDSNSLSTPSMTKQPDSSSSSVSSSPSSTTSTPSTPSTSDMESKMSALSTKVDTIADSVAKLIEFLSGGAVAKAPIQNLQGLQKREPETEQKPDPVVEILTSGDKHAFAKAAVAAGVNGVPDVDKVYEAANKEVFEQLANSGAYSALYGRGAMPMFNPALQAAQEALAAQNKK